MPNKVAYADIQQLLLFAASKGKAHVKLETNAKAWQYLQRMNRYRKLDRKENGGESYWDNFVFKRPTPDGRIDIELRERFEPGSFKIFDADGNSLDAEYEAFYNGPKKGSTVYPTTSGPKLEYSEADAMAEAKRVAARLGITPEDEVDEGVKLANEIRERDIEAARKPLKLDE
jgi:hypothetical protein